LDDDELDRSRHRKGGHRDDGRSQKKFHCLSVGCSSLPNDERILGIVRSARICHSGHLFYPRRVGDDLLVRWFGLSWGAEAAGARHARVGWLRRDLTAIAPFYSSRAILKRSQRFVS
jgi:hypothetical protein